MDLGAPVRPRLEQREGRGRYSKPHRAQALLRLLSRLLRGWDRGKEDSRTL